MLHMVMISMLTFMQRDYQRYEIFSWVVRILKILSHPWFDWDNDGFDDVIMVGGRNMHRISYLETSTCSNNRGDVCSGTSFSLSHPFILKYVLNPIDYPVQVLDCAPRLTNLNVDVSWDIAVENVSFVTQTTT